MKVLITDGDYENALAITRSLGRKGIYVSVISDNYQAISFYSRYCKEKIVSPSITDEKTYTEFLAKTLSKNRYDLLMPVSTGATLITAKNKEMIQKYTNLVVSDYEKVVSAMDKKFVYETAHKLGIPRPETFYPQDIKDIGSKDLIYPLVVKAQHQTWMGHKVNYAFNKEELIKSWMQMKEETGESPMVQEYVSGEGYGFFALYDKGGCKRIFMHRRIREIPSSGGASACSESYYDEKLKYYGEKILTHLKWHGIAMVEFKKPDNGDYKIMEINPRFWGSLDLSIKAGADFPYYLTLMAQGQNLTYSEEYNRNLRFQWIFTREIKRLVEKPSSLANFLVDLINPKVKSDVRINDIFPNLIEAKNTLRFYGINLLKKLRKVLTWK